VTDANDRINQGLAAARLICATRDNLRAPPLSMKRATVDHICLSDNLRATWKLEAWQGIVDGVKLSDHNGVLVDLEIADTRLSRARRRGR
jgi:hypothetical protein